MICTKLTRTIPSVKNHRRSFTIWQCGVLRVVRNFFEYPVLLLFKIPGRRHGLLHLWDLSDTHVHETIDRREIQHLVHPAFVLKRDRVMLLAMRRLMRIGIPPCEDMLTEAIKLNYKSILERFQHHDTYSESQHAIR